MENNNGKGIFYGVIGVATLIVAIIGATFAYFTATTASGQYVTGTAATASLSVAVERLTGHSNSESGEDIKYTMVPQLDAGLSAAIQGVRTQIADENGKNPGEDGYVPTYSYGNACIDSGGSLVCSIYKITVQNTGSAAISVNGSLNFYVSDTLVENSAEDGAISQEGLTAAEDTKMNNLKWARLVDPASLGTGYSRATADANRDLPTTLLTYADDVQYTVESDGVTPVYYGADNTENIYQYAFGNTTNDLYGTSKLKVVSHAASTDLIDPSDDPTCTLNTATADVTDDYTCTATNSTVGQYYLTAQNTTGDTKVFYIVVWISENMESQNATNKGTFVGQVTFNSSAGSGATSTFTEAYSS